ncbi:MAG: FAD-dependent oxidoreductase [Pseudomonadota bacterium]
MRSEGIDGMKRERVIIGGGLAGACAALALAARGVASTVIERDAQAMNRASLRNEGKIHLGLIYAADGSGATARLQLRGALTFAPLLRGWGVDMGAVSIARPFAYLAAPDSLQSPEALEAHYDGLSDLAAEWMAADPALDYLGRRPGRLARRLGAAEAGRWFSPDHAQAVFDTEELAVDTAALAAEMRRALAASPLIEVLTRHDLRAARRIEGGFRLEGQGPDGVFDIEARQVINAAWENLYRFDAEAEGPAPTPGWLHRLKYRVMARLPERLEAAPSMTMVLGAYGDVVVRPGGLSYLSWYPTGCRGWSDAVSPPSDWDAACRGEADAETAAQVAEGALAHLGAIFPGVEAAQVGVVDAGAILAHGKTDVDDPESGLHDRTEVGPALRDGWMSLNPGKLTTAPLLAERAAQALTGARAAA